MLYVLTWVLAAVVVGLAVGYTLGRAGSGNRERDLARREREATLKALVAVLESAQQLSTDVDSHTSEITKVRRQMGTLRAAGELDTVRHALLGQIGLMLDANRRLEDDLRMTRHRMEVQAQEIDRTRAEARLDSLSGVANRKALDEKLEYLLTNFRRTGETFALILSDVDHFKWINDTHGHPAGDQVVSHIGETLRGVLRGGDFVGRYGGDEFAVLLPNTSREVAEKVAERIRQTINRANFNVGPGGERVAVTFSVGLTTVREGDDSAGILQRADRGLYLSKQGGRNLTNAVWEPEEMAAASE